MANTASHRKAQTHPIVFCVFHADLVAFCGPLNTYTELDINFLGTIIPAISVDYDYRGEYNCFFRADQAKLAALFKAMFNTKPMS